MPTTNFPFTKTFRAPTTGTIEPQRFFGVVSNAVSQSLDSANGVIGVVERGVNATQANREIEVIVHPGSKVLLTFAEQHIAVGDLVTSDESGNAIRLSSAGGKKALGKVIRIHPKSEQGAENTFISVLTF